jgi:hypothetical protein
MLHGVQVTFRMRRHPAKSQVQIGLLLVVIRVFEVEVDLASPMQLETTKATHIS